jgi:hypothetical protein
LRATQKFWLLQVTCQSEKAAAQAQPTPAARAAHKTENKNAVAHEWHNPGTKTQTGQYLRVPAGVAQSDLSDLSENRLYPFESVHQPGCLQILQQYHRFTVLDLA